MSKYTDITVLLDRSGSMASIKPQMESALNEFFHGHKQIKSTRATLVQFDTTNPYELVFENRPICEVPKVRIVPLGGTPLLDALCNTIDKTGQRLSWMSPEKRPDQVLFVVITDGEENSSRTYKKQDVQDRIQHQTNKYKWEFTFLGADQNAFNEALTLGFDYNKSLWFNGANSGYAVGNALLSNTMSFADRTLTRVASYDTNQRSKAINVNPNDSTSGGTTTDLTDSQ